MSSTNTVLNTYKIQLEHLEEKLGHSYNMLGKKTLEFLESQIGEINELVDEIVKLKKTIERIENNKNTRMTQKG